MDALIKRPVSRRKFLGLVGAAALAPLATGVTVRTAHAARKITVTSYGGVWEEFIRSEVLPDFEKQNNCTVELAVGLAKDWMAQLRAAGVDKPAPYDVVVCNEVYAAHLRREGFFIDLPADKIPNLKDVYDICRNKNDNGVLVLIQPLGLVYRTDKVKAPPKSWKDLWKPEYKGQLGLLTITNSGTIMFFLLMAKLFGKSEKDVDAAFEAIKKLKPFKQTDYSGDMEKLLTQREISIGLLDIAAAARLKKQGIPVDYVTPSEGLFMFEQDHNITKGSRDRELAAAFINYQLSMPVQEKWMKKYFLSPANRKVAMPADLRKDIPIHGERMKEILKWDWEWVIDNREQFTARWNKEISG